MALPEVQDDLEEGLLQSAPILQFALLRMQTAEAHARVCRRSFSFDDLDDMVNGGNRKARGHREDFASQMAPPQPRRQQIGLQDSEIDHQRLHSGER